MKPGKPADLRVRVGVQADEEDASVAALYEGVYVVTLNALTDIAFLPEVDWSSWPPPLPANLDAPSSAVEARRWLLARSAWAVVVDGQRAGKDEAFARFKLEGEPAQGRCFFIGAGEHAALQEELSRLGAELRSVHASVPLSSLRGSALGRILQRVVDSPHFSG